MNVWFLVAAVAVVFVFGYRFYAKLLALDIYRLERNYSTPAQTRADGRDYVPTHPQLLLGHHLAAVGGAALFAAPMAAVAWGWIPLFLWITLGSAVVAGTYALGGFWLSVHYPNGWREIVTHLIGRPARVALYLAALTALGIVAAASAGLAGSILVAYPGVVLPLAAIALIATAFGTFLHGRAEFELLPASVLAFIAAMLSLWLLSDTPLAFTGALTIAFGKTYSISVQGLLVWVVLLLVYCVHAARAPVWRVMRPRGFLTSLLLVALMVIFYVAAGVQAPTLVAPQFHPTTSSASSLPWIFLLVGPGAIAGWQLLVIHRVTAPELRRETDATYVGYGAALLQGLVALSALLIAATNFTNGEQWAREYTETPSAMDFPRFAVAYVEGFARYAKAIYIDTSLAKQIAATVIAGVALSVLEGAIRALKHLLADVSPAAAQNRAREGERARLWIIALVVGAIALYDGRGLGGLAAWPLLSMISLWLAAAGFALIATACLEIARPALLHFVLAAAIGVVALWSSAMQMWSWWTAGAYLEFVAGLVVVLAMVPVSWGFAHVLLHRPAGALDT